MSSAANYPELLVGDDDDDDEYDYDDYNNDDDYNDDNQPSSAAPVSDRIEGWLESVQKSAETGNGDGKNETGQQVD
jgi:hypothetical protein